MRTGIAPVLYLVLVELSPKHLAIPCAMGFLAGFAAVLAGPNVRAVAMNVNTPSTLGLALALHATLDDVGKGLGPALVAPMVAQMGRRWAFAVATLGWVPCATLLGGLAWTVRRDEWSKHQHMAMVRTRAAPVSLTLSRPALCCGNRGRPGSP